MYNSTIQAILEQYGIHPRLEIDLNDGNIGFDMNGNMKYFDIRYFM